jgi:hypothetical protein
LITGEAEKDRNRFFEEFVRAGKFVRAGEIG